jgi:hypothetical protein
MPARLRRVSSANMISDPLTEARLFFAMRATIRQLEFGISFHGVSAPFNSLEGCHA